MKRNILSLFCFIALMPMSAIAENYELLIKNNKGNSYDIVNNSLKNAPSSLRSDLVLTFSEGQSTLDTGLVKLKGHAPIFVQKQATFFFEAESALWIVTFYPALDKCFVNVHSDASDYGGAKMLNLIADCDIKNP